MRHEDNFDFLVDAAHELQTPIAILAGNLEMLERGNAQEKNRAMRVMRNTITDMSRLTNGLLQAARLRGAPDELCRERINIKDLLNETHEDCLVLALNAGLIFTVQAWEIYIVGDRKKLKEVLLNLISNAVRHTAAGGVICLSAERSLPPEGQENITPRAQISVSDTGCGIAAENLPHIFERLYKIPAPGSKGSTGTGLGLYLCRQIIVAHGGTITAESEAEKGSVFTISLPAPAKPEPAAQ